MQSKTLRLVSFVIGALAVVAGVDIAPDAAGFLLARGNGGKDIRIEDVYYSCVNGNSFAMVRNGAPGDVENFDAVEAGEMTVYVPKSMSFENDTPRIVAFPRKSGVRDVGVPNTKR